MNPSKSYELHYKLQAFLALIGLASLAVTIDFIIIGQDHWSLSALPLTLLFCAGIPALLLGLYLRRAALRRPELYVQPARRWMWQFLTIISILAIIVHVAVQLFLIISGHYNPVSDTYDSDVRFMLDPSGPGYDYGSAASYPVFWKGLLVLAVTIIIGLAVCLTYRRGAQKHDAS